jgi:hypothetical protein
VTSRGIDILLISAIACVLVTPLCRRAIARRLDPFEPFVLFVLAYGVMFVVRPTIMVAEHTLVFDGPIRALDVSPHFTQMLLLALVGAVGFTVAYELPSKLGPSVRWDSVDREMHIDNVTDRRRLIHAAFVLAALGLLAFTIFAASADGFRTVSEIVHANKVALAAGEGTYRYLWLGFFVLVPASSVLFGLGLSLRHRTILASSALLALTVLFNAVPLGNRTVLLPLAGSLFVLYYLERGRRPSWRTLSMLAIIAVFLSPFLSDLRGRGTRGEDVAATIARMSKPSRLAQPFTNGPDSEMAPALAAALSVIPRRLPYEYGRVIFEDLALRPIPRPLWSGKPAIPRDRLIAAIWPVEATRGALNPEFSILLYFYWDFGITGVFLGMAAFGMGARYVYEHFRLREHSLSSRVIYSLSLWFVVIALRDSPVDTVVWAAFLILPAWAIFRRARMSSHVEARATAHVEAPRSA